MLIIILESTRGSAFSMECFLARCLSCWDRGKPPYSTVFTHWELL